jgi:SNF2 family DNA or RNA helicase
MVMKRIHEVSYKLNEQQKNEYYRLWEEYERQKMEENPESELNKELIEGGIYRRYLSNQMVPNTIALTEEFISHGEKVVIACCYDEELYTLQEYFGDKCVIYNGKMNSKEKDAAQNAFMTDKDIKVFIGNLQSAGVGISLVVSTKLIFNSFSYSNADNKQMEDRVHRLNQKNDVDIYYQFFDDTQNEKMWNIVLKKDDIFKTVIKTENNK